MWKLVKGYHHLRRDLTGKARVPDGPERDAALGVLRQVYAERPDLQEVYPEAADNDLRRLMAWAAGVSTNRWKDGSHVTLKPYAKIFQIPKEDVPDAPIPWTVALETSHSSGNQLQVALDVMKSGVAGDISQHLLTLSLVITEFNLRSILELGTRDGNSTLVLLEAARSIGGHVTSVDVEPCLIARERVRSTKLDPLWTFLQADDLHLVPPQVPESIDFLFIDTSHNYAHTIAELKKYAAYLSDGAWIGLHDYVSFPGVHRAVEEFVKSISPRAHFYPYMHQNGLALLRVRDLQKS